MLDLAGLHGAQGGGRGTRGGTSSSTSPASAARVGRNMGYDSGLTSPQLATVCPGMYAPVRSNAKKQGSLRDKEWGCNRGKRKGYSKLS